MTTPLAVTEVRRHLLLEVEGAVQGVGFRPFVFRLATEMGLVGSVRNSSQGAVIDIEGEERAIAGFVPRLRSEAPPRSDIQRITEHSLPLAGFSGFEIVASVAGGTTSALVLADIATCDDCLSEIRDPLNRRYRYPFTNCTNCGPRYSIIQGIPYDRAVTTMRSFVMCPQCQAEYDDPRNRRFHAQPNACPVCGPTLTYSDQTRSISHGDRALQAAVLALTQGRIVAVKGLGGFHLMVDARNEEAVRTLRRRKRREAKPLAIMAPNLDGARSLCRVSDAEAVMLALHQAPIVLLRRESGDGVAENVAPNNPYLGVMLPYTPLHHVLLADLGFPLVATSGNLSEEPICIENGDAFQRLGSIADNFLTHDRPIERQVDDSIVQVVLGEAMVLRRSRGYAPLPITIDKQVPPSFGAGAHLKSTVAIGRGDKLFLSQHIGDLETEESMRAYTRTSIDLPRLHELTPLIVGCDLHPDYGSTQYARKMGLPLKPVQHHYAHILSCMAEHGLAGPVLGVAWDGTGYGTDGTIWGGEFLVTSDDSFERVAHLRQFRLPGGDFAIREPRRSALGVLYEIFRDSISDMMSSPGVVAFSSDELRVMLRILERRVNSPVTSSAGRLFDALASLLGLLQKSEFEGQAAMRLEFAIPESPELIGAYDFGLGRSTSVDWEPMIRSVLGDIHAGIAPKIVSTRVHNTFVDMIVAVARRECLIDVVLSGGCFQNRYLLEQTVRALRSSGHRVFWNQQIPINDGGVAVGQVIATCA